MPWNGSCLNITSIANGLAISRPTARHHLARLQREGSIRLLPFFGTGRRPIVLLVGWYDDQPASFRAFCTDAVIARFRELDPACSFHYWATGRVRRVDLLAVISHKRVGFCFSDHPISQPRHWWPLHIAMKRGVVDLGWLLNAGWWPGRIGRGLYERSIGKFLSHCADPGEPLDEMLRS